MKLLYSLLFLLLPSSLLAQTPAVLTFKKDSTLAWDYLSDPAIPITKFRVYKSVQPARGVDGIFDDAVFKDIPTAVPVPATTTFQWMNIDDGVHYFAVTAIIENDGEVKESKYSNIVVLTVDTKPVPPPKTLRILKLTAKNTAKGEAVIAWETDVPTKGILKLFRNGNPKGTWTAQKNTKQKIRIDNLKRNSEYQFIVFVDDKKGNTFTSDLTTFKTL